MLRNPTNPPKNRFLHVMSLAVTDEHISSAGVDHDLGAGGDTCPKLCLSSGVTQSPGAFLQDTEMTALLIIPIQGYFTTMPMP